MREQKIKLFDILDTLRKTFPSYADSLGAEFDDETEIIRRAAEAETLTVQQDEAIIVGKITTIAPDSYEDVVLPEGMDSTRYEKNNVVLRSHNYNDYLPHGQCVWLRQYPSRNPREVRAATQYYLDDAFGLAVFNHRKKKRPLGYSIGFIPTKKASSGLGWYRKTDDWEEELEKWKDRYAAYTGGKLTAKNMPVVNAIYLKWVLLEYSDVSVPANPDTLDIGRTFDLERLAENEQDVPEGLEELEMDQERLIELLFKGMEESPELKERIRAITAEKPDELPFDRDAISAEIKAAFNEIPEWAGVIDLGSDPLDDFSVTSLIKRSQGELV